jgi:hypothetical protein
MAYWIGQANLAPRPLWTNYKLAYHIENVSISDLIRKDLEYFKILPPTEVICQ